MIIIIIIITFIFWPRENPWWLKSYKRKLRNLFGSEPDSGRSSSTPSCSKTELQRCTTKEIRWNKNEHIPGSSPPIAWPTRSKTEEHPSWLGLLAPSQSGGIQPVMRVEHTWPPCLTWQLGCSACLARRSFQIGIRSCARYRHISYERPARAPRNQYQPIRAFSVGTTKTR